MKRITYILSIGWILIVLASFILSINEGKNVINELAKIEAETNYSKDIVYRKWASAHGGVYVPISDSLQPNQYLNNPERDIVTPSGKRLTLVNPAYMTRQVHELGKRDYGYRAHITSLNVIRPENKPSELEAKALKKFNDGINEYSEILSINNEKVLFYMRPMIAEQSCLKCHANQGYKVGDVRGGLSVIIPMDRYDNILKKDNFIHGLIHFAFLAIGLLGIYLSTKKMAFQIKETEKALKTSQQKERELNYQNNEYAALNEEYKSQNEELLSAKNLLEDSRERYRQLSVDLAIAQKIAKVGSWKWYIQDSSLDWSDEMYRIFEIDKNDFSKKLNDVIQSRIHPDDRDAVNASNNSVAEHATPIPVEYRLVLPSGVVKTVWGEAGDIVFDSNGKPLILSGIVKDITEQKKLEFELKEKNEEFETLNEELLQANIEIRFAKNIVEEREKKLELQNKEIELNNQRLERLLSISHFKTNSIQELLNFALDEAIKLTESGIGYIYFYNEESQQFTLNTWSKDVMKECQVLNPQTVYDLDKTGIWGEAVRQRKPIVLNDFQAHNPLKKGIPQGHVGLKNFLTIPVIFDNKIVAVAGVANKAGDYNSTDIRQLTLLMDSVWKISERVTLIDVLKKAKEDAEENEKQFRSLFENLEQGFALHEMIYDDDQNPIDYRYILINKAFERLTGIKADEFIGRTVKELLPNTEQIWIDNYGKVARTGEPLQFDNYSQEFNKYYDVVAYSPQKDFFAVIFTDITKNKNYEREIIIAKEKAEESEIRFKAISEQAMDGVTLADMQGNYFFVNQSFCKMIGYSEKELLEMSVFDLRPADDDSYLFEEIRIQSFGSVQNKKLKCKNGSIIYADINGQKVKTENEEFILGFVRDVTERVEREKELIEAKEKAEESDKFKTAFLQNMSHEIRTPMNGIIGFSERLSKPDLTEEKKQKYISIIINSTNQLLSIVNDILAISSLETKQEKIVLTQVRLNSLLVEMQSAFEMFAKNKGISLIVDVDKQNSSVEISSDATKLKQVITNLVTNAIKFTHQGSVTFGFSIEKADKHNEILFFVKDTGIGISKENQQKIFERFRQADVSIGQKYGGTGLGLAISKAYVELLGGKIWVESEPNKGTTFYFTIPFQKQG